MISESVLSVSGDVSGIECAVSASNLPWPLSIVPVRIE